jgi:hypothetical protein
VSECCYPKFAFTEEEIEGFVSGLLKHSISETLYNSVSPAQMVEILREVQTITAS